MSDNVLLRRERNQLRRENRKLREELRATHALNENMQQILQSVFKYDPTIVEMYETEGNYGFKIMFSDPIANDFHTMFIELLNDSYVLLNELSEARNEQG